MATPLVDDTAVDSDTPPKRRRTLYFSELQRDCQWCSEVDGIIRFVRATKLRSNRVLSDESRLALALNDICYQRRQGRVFLVQCQPTKPSTERRDASAYRAYSPLAALPALIYLPSSICDEQAQEWQSLTPEERLHRCWAPHGWVHPEVAVLPFNTRLKGALQENRKTAVESKPFYFHGVMQCPVMVVIMDAIYIGSTDDWIAESRQIKRPNLNGELYDCQFEMTDWSRVQHLQVDKLDSVVDELHHLCHLRPDYLCQYQSLVDAIQRAFQKGSQDRE